MLDYFRGGHSDGAPKNRTAIADLDAAETCRLRVFRAIERPDHTNNMWEVAFAYFATV